MGRGHRSNLLPPWPLASRKGQQEAAREEVGDQGSEERGDGQADPLHWDGTVHRDPDPILHHLLDGGDLRHVLPHDLKESAGLRAPERVRPPMPIPTFSTPGRGPPPTATDPSTRSAQPSVRSSGWEARPQVQPVIPHPRGHVPCVRTAARSPLPVPVPHCPCPCPCPAWQPLQAHGQTAALAGHLAASLARAGQILHPDRNGMDMGGERGRRRHRLLALCLASSTLQGDAYTRSLQVVPDTPSGMETQERFAQWVPLAASHPTSWARLWADPPGGSLGCDARARCPNSAPKGARRAGFSSRFPGGG